MYIFVSVVYLLCVVITVQDTCTLVIYVVVASITMPYLKSSIGLFHNGVLSVIIRYYINFYAIHVVVYAFKEDGILNLNGHFNYSNLRLLSDDYKGFVIDILDDIRDTRMIIY